MPSLTTRFGEREYETPVVIIGLNATALGVIRSLAPHCKDITAFESDRTEPGIHTRLCELVYAPDLADCGALLEQLVAVARTKGERPVLFLTADAHVTWAAGPARETLERHFRMFLPPDAVCRDLMFKDRFLDLANRKGYPIPTSAFVSVQDLPDRIAEARLAYPVILKPATKAGAWQGSGMAKAYIVRGAWTMPG